MISSKRRQPIIQEGSVRVGNITYGPMTPRPPIPITGFSPKSTGGTSQKNNDGSETNRNSQKAAEES